MTGQAGEGSEGRRARILLIEDDEDLRLLLRLTLQRDPRLEVLARWAEPEEAIELASTLDPDVVIVDHHLRSGRQGFDVAADLRSKHPDAKILLLTGYDLRGPHPWSESVDGVLRKDELRDLLPSVQHLLDLSSEAG